MVLIGLVLDLLMPVLVLVAVGLLIWRRKWPLWKAYRLSMAVYLLYANASARLIFGGHIPSNYVLVITTFAVDGLIPWHQHGAIVNAGHTDREVGFMVAVYPVVALLIVPTLVFWLISFIRQPTRPSGGRVHQGS